MLDFSRDFVRSEGIINSPDFDQVTFEIGLESKLLEYPRHLDPRGMCKRRVNGGTTAPSEKLPQLKRRYVYGGYNKPGLDELVEAIIGFCVLIK